MRQLNITTPTFKDMLDYGNTFPDQEICGMLVGNKDSSTEWTANKLIKITNVDAETDYQHYTMDPNEFLSALELTTHANDDADLDFVGIYHTHPHNKAIPSSKDINRAGYCVFFPIYSPVYDELSLHFCTEIKKPWIKSKLNII